MRKHKTKDGNRISGAFSNRSHYAIEDGSEGSPSLGTNHYMLDTGEVVKIYNFTTLEWRNKKSRLTAGG